MINYGKIAYEELRDLSRDKVVNLKLNAQWVTKEITSADNELIIELDTLNERIYFLINFDFVASISIFVNSKLDYIKYNFTTTEFALLLEKKSTIKFVFTVTQYPAILKCRVLGVFDGLFENKNKYFCYNGLTRAILKEPNSFNYYFNNSNQEVVDDLNNNTFQSISGDFLDMVNDGSKDIFLVNLTDGSYVKSSIGNEIKLTTNLKDSDSCVLYYLETFQSYLVMQLDNYKINFYLFDNNFSLQQSFIKDIKQKNIKKISKVFSGNNIYLILTDVNNNNYIVLCKVVISPLNITFLGFVLLGKSENAFVNLVSNVFYISLPNAYGVVKKQMSINFNSNISNVIKMEKFNNLTDLCVLDKNKKILNFQNTYVYEV